MSDMVAKASSYPDLAIRVHNERAAIEESLGNAHQAAFERERARALSDR